MQLTPSLQLHNINKRFPSHKLFTDLSYSFESGCYSLVGPNGIGKSTLLAMMVGCETFDSGQVIINNLDLVKDPVRAKTHLAYVPAQCQFYPFVSGKEFIDFMLRIRKTHLSSATERLIDLFNLTPYLEVTFGNMSLGTQKKFMLAASSIGEPSILILDEPSNGLESATQQILLDHLIQQSVYKLIILATHDKSLLDRLPAKRLQLGHTAPVEKLLS